MPPVKQKQYGWFSAEAACQYRPALYERPDGTVVEVTNVCEHESVCPEYRWRDKWPVGEVTRCLRLSGYGSLVFKSN